MNPWLIAFVFSIPLLAFAMWLTFNAVLVRWHGLDALRATSAVYRAFNPAKWSRHLDDAEATRSPSDS